jgi:hypothetical protein
MANPTVPTAQASAAPFGFWFEVPLAFDPSNDLRGALLAQTSVGECYLNIDWNSSLITSGSADSVYNGAATSTAILNSTYGGIQIQTWQEFYLPQAINGQLPLPQIDLLTVYELAGNIKSTDNIAANTEKLINLPNVRSVIGTYVEFVNNGVMNSPGTDVSQVRLIANGNNILYDNSGEGHVFEQRLILNSDIRKGTYFYLSRKKAIETALYGNVQFGITPSSVSNSSFTSHMDIAFESFYTKGISLPGLSQASG